MPRTDPHDPKPAVDLAAVERQVAENPSLRDAATAYIQAPYTETTAWAKSWLCAVLDHPDKYPEGMKPRYKPEGCPCGKRRGLETA